MTGKEIADNLRGTKLKWGRRQLASRNGYHCVLGIKGIEHGVTLEQLRKLDGDVRYSYENWDSTLGQITAMNDSCDTKEELIAKFEENPDEEYAVELFIEKAKAVQV